MQSLDDIKTTILAKIDLGDYIGEHVRLEKRSHLRVGCCPFHEEKSASFTVYPDHFFCFGCKANGDLISFVRKLHGFGYIDALKHLAPRAGIADDVFERRDRSREDGFSQAQIYRALLLAQEFFVKQLQDPRAESVRSYLRGRGFSDESTRSFGFGLAPAEPRALTEYLLRQGFQNKLLEECALATTSTRSMRVYDFFQNRLMVPIRDVHQRIVGFGGRALDDTPPKYKNSRESRIFDKSQLLFGFDRAREAIRKGARPLICEGYMDVLQLWQNGFDGAVAVMGTALKSSHLKALAQVSSRVILLLDGDAAGQKASLHTVSAALEVPSLRIDVVTLPDNHDPDSFLLAHGRDALLATLERGMELFDFAVRTKLKEAASPLAIPNILRREIVPWLQTMQDPLRLNYLTGRVAELSGVDRRMLQSEISRATQESRLPAAAASLKREGAGPEAVPRESAPAALFTRPLQLLEFEIFAHLFFADPKAIDLKSMEQALLSQLDLDEGWETILRMMMDCLNQGNCPADLDPGHWPFGDEALLQGFFSEVKSKRAAFTGSPDAALSRIMTRQRLKAIQMQIKNLKAQLGSSDPATSSSLLKAIKDLQQDVRAIEAQS